MYHKGTGIIEYDPSRTGMKRNTNWWAVIKIDPEITRYYRWWVMREYWLELKPPAWNAHISIVRGEKPANDKIHLWKKYHGQVVDFSYSHNVQQATKPEFWIVEVVCPIIKDIRSEFGFLFKWKSHITIGKNLTNRYL